MCSRHALAQHVVSMEGKVEPHHCYQLMRLRLLFKHGHFNVAPSPRRKIKQKTELLEGIKHLPEASCHRREPGDERPVGLCMTKHGLQLH